MGDRNIRKFGWKVANLRFSMESLCTYSVAYFYFNY